ncbi:class I SAM-dependent methyltransferase [Polynucleobacter necessarius]|uniref:class I SAM-dependent methyltransferase n=1 Tax=Polynucleobacter necessarius TaxID=576610 RepID=UPI000E09CD2C|nr:class I SAM-dependent methyltransferase [Polynucleobacter necessarius]
MSNKDGEHKYKCAFCSSKSLTEVLDLGEVALAGGFLSLDQFAGEPKFPLRVYFCNDCLAVQVIDIIDPQLMFGNYFYFSSQIKTLRNHFEDYATEVVSRFLEPRKSTVLEFGCNDGVLLRPLADQGIRTLIGVDPASNIISTINDERINVVNDYFTEATSNSVIERFGKVDMVVANNVYAHIPDICGVTRAVKNVLSDDGVFIFEVHYLGKIIQGMQYDMIYHEHLYYYSLIALENHFKKHGMVVFDIKAVPIHGGSMRYYVCKKDATHANNISTRVDLLRNEELQLGYDKPETYRDFASKVRDSRERLMNVLVALKAKGRTVAGYGASGRANTIIQYCGIDNSHVEYMIDDAPAKTGFYTPGSHLEIYSNEVLKVRQPDYLLIFAWSFINEIAAKCEGYMDNGGKLLIPLPEVRIMMTPYSEDIL